MKNLYGNNFPSSRFQLSIPFSNALIPGINNINSVGTKATCRAGSIGAPGSIASYFPDKNENKMKLADQFSNYSTIQYNPITNPLPIYNQNPYIQKQMQKAYHNLK